MATLLVGCGDDGGPTFSSDVSDAEAAAGACGLLVTWTNDVAETVNDVQDEMVEGADIQALMQSPLDDVIVLHRGPADGPGGARLPGHRRAATPSPRTCRRVADAAAEDLEGFRAEVEAIPDPDPEALQFRKAQMVVELEKPRSLVKPDVQGDLGDEDLEAAIAAEESCDFVTRSQ